MRPRGELSQALVKAAASGPAPVRALAERAQVGYSAARYTASRMVDRGELVVLEAGRPALLGVPSAPPVAPAGDEMGDHLDALHRAFFVFADCYTDEPVR
jgi:hypothetical protein